MTQITQIWSDLTREHGRKCVMALGIDEATLDAETQRQVNALAAMIRPLLRETDRTALDFGCGAGRFTPMLGHLIGETVGYDPCGALLALAPPAPRVAYLSATPAVFLDHCREERLRFDVLFIFNVLGGLETMALPALAEELLAILSPGGLLILADHTAFIDPGRWWRFRTKEFYTALFGKSRGCPISEVGEIRQLTKPVTVFAGRKA